MLLLMIYVPTIKYWGTGPAWPQAGIDIDECRTTWWKNLLYINNIVDSDRQVSIESKYKKIDILSVDFHNVEYTCHLIIQ